MKAATIRFTGATGLAQFLTLTAQPVSAEIVADAVHHICLDPESPACGRALDRVAAEAFPRRGWRERLVNPAAHLRRLTPDLQLAVLRALIPVGTVLYGS